MKNTKIKVVKGLIIFVLFFLVFYVCKSTISSMLTIRPEKFIVHWEQKQEVIKGDLALGFVERLKRSVALAPDNARNHFLLARLYELIALQDDETLDTGYTTKANNSYKQAILNQPSWDIAWARLAKLNSVLNNDNIAIKALEKSLVLGLYENQNQRIIIPIIIKYWDAPKFIENNRTAIKNLFTHALKFEKNHSWLLNRVLQSKNIDMLRFTAPLIKHQYQLHKFNQYMLKHPELTL